MTNSEISDFKVLFFDGNCLLCQKSIQLILKWEKTHDIYFSALNSELAKSMPDIPNIDSAIYLKGGKFFIKSTAVINVLMDMGGVCRFGQIFFLIPRVIRDFVYDWVAKNRYFIFGKTDTCYIPSKETQDRFLEK